MGTDTVAGQDRWAVASFDSASTNDPMSNKPAFAALPAIVPVSSRAPTPAAERGVRDGLVLRRGPEGDVRPTTAVVSPNEALPLHGSRATRHTETLSAVTSVELAVLEAPALRAAEASEALLSRLVAGPQSIACIRCWARFGWIAEAQGAERLRRALATLALRLGDESPLVSDVRLKLDALAAWMAMPLSDALAAATLLQAQGLVTVRDDMLCSIHPRATGPTPW